MVRIDELLRTKPFGVVAHRGGGLEAPENRIAGIRHGLKSKKDIDKFLISLLDSDEFLKYEDIKDELE